VDAPAAGHAVTFLRSAAGMAGAATVGPVRDQALDALAMLRDPARCTVVLVTLAEETPVSELVETAFSLEDEVGVALGPVVVNAVWPPIEGLDRDPATVEPGPGQQLDPTTVSGLRGASRFHNARVADQTEQLQRLAAELPLPRVVLPQVFSDRLHLDDIEHLADALGAQMRMAGR
jgi:hypothetical protein